MKIDFYGDLTCPWCHLGWRRLQLALKQRPEVDLPVVWRPYQLNPDLPLTGIDRQDYMLRKFANSERVREVQHAVEVAMRADGLHVNLHRIKITSNSYLGHRLMLLAQEAGITDKLLQEFFVAYFVEGQDIGDPHMLTAIAHAAGLESGAVYKEINSTEPCAGITQSELDARQMGIRAVPYFVFGGKYSIAGAHDPVAFQPLIDLCDPVLNAPDAAE